MKLKLQTACLCLAFLGLMVCPSYAVGLTSEDLDEIDPTYKAETISRTADAGLIALPLSQNELHIARLQILMDRVGLSPGAVNGQDSDYLKRLLDIFQTRYSVSSLSDNSENLDAALETSGGEAFKTYKLTASDLRGPFLDSIPKRIQDQESLKSLSFSSVAEAIAERFHMDENFLKRLNPNFDFTKTGSELQVANIGTSLDLPVARIVANKSARQVTAYDAKGRILAAYPASIGSLETPSPKGTFRVRNKAGFPFYTLSPNNSFEKVDSHRQYLIAPGPNNPVGIAWIGLSEKGYGIHGTPEPSLVGTSYSNGCIRLTNWDAFELAKLVRTGVEVVIE